MSHSLANILIHATFRTINRSTLIPRELWGQHFAYLQSLLSSLDCHSLQIGGVADHIHLCFRLNKEMKISEVMGKVKANSSRWLKEKGVRNFSWKTGYGAFSISQSHAARVVKYIQNQEEHHRHQSFRDEYFAFLKEHNIECDVRVLEDDEF
jgi:REP element-mobilizing transposase RayT